VDYQEALARLANHANIPDKGTTLKPEDSFLYIAWQANQTKSPQDFRPLYSDILSCLGAVNLALNGPTPSESIQTNPPPVDAKLCYSISGILSGGWSDHFKWSQKRMFSQDFLDEFASLLVRIGIAWDLVLAGDMDNIPEDTALEFRMQQA
jgi:hypothetical protein